MAVSVPRPTTWVALSGPEFGLSAASDTPLDFGSAATGQEVDRSTALAAAMSGRFASGNVGILVDRAVTGVLPIHGSNVVVRGLHPGCGFRCPPGWSGPVVHNAQQVLGLSGGSPVAPVANATAPVTLGGFAQSRIALRGLTVHGGSPGVAAFVGNSVGPKTGILFWGVDGPSIRDCRIYDTAGYMVYSANCRRGRYRDNDLAVSNITQSDGRDGFHNDGPIDDLIIAGNRIASGDDAVSGQGNDGDPSTLGFPFARPGPVTGLSILDNTLVGCASGFNFISSDQVVDRLLLRGNSGTCRIAGVVIQTFTASAFPAGNNPHPGAGAFGSIRIEDHDVSCSIDPLGVGNFIINAAFDALTIRGYKLRTVPGVVTPNINMVAGTSYNSFDCEFAYTDVDSGNTARVLVRDDGVGRFARVVATVARPGLASRAIPIYRKSAGSLVGLSVEARAENINNLVDYAGGTIGSVALRGVHSGAGGGGSVAVASGLTLANLAAHGLATALIKSGAGTVSHQYPASETYAL